MTMNSYSFPGKTVFGPGAASTLPELLPPGRPLVVIGTHTARSAAGKNMLAKIAPFEPVLHLGVPAEPPLESVDEIIQEGRSAAVSSVIAVGGGSVMDAAKAAAALIPREGTVSDYFSGQRAIPGKGLFFAALPTTAGTGAESTNNAVLTDPATKIKKSLRHPLMKADLALVDPELTYGCPASVTAASGLDAFIQSVECYTNPKGSALTRAMSSAAAGMILKNLRNAVLEPENTEARNAMAEASMICGLAFSSTGLGAVHGFAHPAGSLLHIPHGMVCAVFMMPVFRFNAKACAPQYAELAGLCGCGTTAEDFLRAARDLAGDLQVPETLAPWKFRKEDIPFILQNCRSASMKSNPVPFTDSDAEVLLETLL